MNRAQIIMTIFLLPVTASLLLVGGLYVMDNGSNDIESSGNPEYNTPVDENINDSPENINQSTNMSESNQSVEEVSNTQLNFLKKRRIKPIQGEEEPEQAFTNFLENRTELANKIMKPDTSTVFLYKGQDSEALFLLNAPGNQDNSVKFVINGLNDAKVLEKGETIERTSQGYTAGWNLSNGTTGAAFIPNGSKINVTVHPEFSGELSWNLISGPTENLSQIQLERNKPLDIKTS